MATISYIRPDDGARMVEVAPHQAVELHAVLALRLIAQQHEESVYTHEIEEYAA